MPFLHIVYATLVSLFWGANFVAVKFGLQHFPPIFMLVLRFAIVAGMLLPFYPRRTLPLKFLLTMSTLFGTLHFCLMFGAMNLGIDIPTAVITIQLGVPFSCLLSAMFFDDRLGGWRSSGLMIAFLGMMLIAGTPKVAENFLPFLMMMGGAFCWAVANMLMKKQGNINILEMLGWVSLFSVPQLMLISIVFEEHQWQLLATITLSAALAIGFMSLFSTVVAYGLWYYLLKHCEISKVAPFNLLSPFFGIAVGQWFFPEPIGHMVLVGGAITILGVAIIVVRKPRLAEFGKIRKMFSE